MSDKYEDLAGVSATIGMPCGPNIPWQTTMSLTAAVRAATKAGVNLQMQCVAGSSDVVSARNAVFTYWYDADPRTDRLFWIDSDMDFNAVDFLHMLRQSLQMPVVAAAYPVKNDSRALIANIPGTQYEINRHGCVKIESLGLGFTVVRREVLDKLAEGKPRKRDSFTGKDLIQVFNREKAGEDITFFRDIGALGYDVWLDPTVELGHVGPTVYKRDVVEALGLSHLYRKG